MCGSDGDCWLAPTNDFFTGLELLHFIAASKKSDFVVGGSELQEGVSRTRRRSARCLIKAWARKCPGVISA